jgi:Arc/MetJ family transcription regulator
VLMTQALVHLDEDSLAKAQEILGTSSAEETVNAAIREVVRRAAADRFMEMAREGAFADLMNPEIMERAWRQ